MKNSKYVLSIVLIMSGFITAMEPQEESVTIDDITIMRQATPRIRTIGNRILSGTTRHEDGYAQLTPVEQKILTSYLKGWRLLRHSMPYRKLE